MNERTGAGQSPMKCADLQPLLLDYLTRELGAARSDLVREHLRRCAACQAAAGELAATVEFLHAAAGPEEAPRLSQAHRSRIARALMHPVQDWVYRHHILASVGVALLAAAVAALALAKLRPWEEEPDAGGVPVRIGPAAATNGPADRP